MAFSLYPLWKQEIMKGNANAALNSAEGATGVYVALVDTGTYTYSDTHQFYSSISASVIAEAEITSKTITGMTFDGADTTLVGVTGVTGEAIVLYRKNAGANTTWPLIMYQDSSITNLPVTPNGGDLVLTWDATGIFDL